MIHVPFIRQPAINLLANFAGSTAALRFVHGAYPLNETIIASIFLQLTGMLEQKCKCIFWTIATVDFEYRYQNKSGLNSEYSSYPDKESIYAAMLERIKVFKEMSDDAVKNKKQELLLKAYKSVAKVFENSTMSDWNPRQFQQLGLSEPDFHDDWPKDKLFGKKLQYAYKQLWNHRNRCAHNTRSYQPNLPTFMSLNDADNAYNNYFLFFTILIFIDEIFRWLFDVYYEELEKRHIIKS